MYYNTKIGSIFMSMNQRETQPWRRDIILGSTDGTWKMHLATSGSATAEFHPLWFARVQENVVVLDGNETNSDASRLLSSFMPEPLRVFQHPERPLSLNVSGLD